MITKNWHVAETISNEVIGSFLEIDPVLLQLLWNRNLKDQSSIDEFISPDWSLNVHDPYLFKDMTKAVERIYETIGSKEVIGVFGDYDADGVCASVILVSTLKKLGAKVEIYLPHREKEGYGLNLEAIRYFKERGVSLLITCDCGIANVTQIEYANELSINVIITDHHQAQAVLPASFAILHPSIENETYPFKLLSGGGVAFKLVQGLLRYSGCHLNETDREAHEKWLTDLVAVSTIADMVKLIGENRTLVTYGLKTLKKTRNLGLSKLIDVSGIIKDRMDSYSVSWQIAPRINAAGRMDHANSAYSLLITENSVEADELARSINLTNTERQRVTDEMMTDALAQIGDISKNTYLIHAFNANWSLGLVGLVAGKLVQKYNRPALVMCQMGDKIFGSGRSGVGNFDLAQSLAKCADLLLSFGGHKEAAGFSLNKDQLETFLDEFTKLTKKDLHNKDLTPVLYIDKVLDFNDISWQVADQVQVLEPFGQGNPKPHFASFNAVITAVQPVGTLGQHLRLELEQNDTRHKFIWFKTSDEGLGLNVGDIIDVVYDIGINEWNGYKSLELKIIDVLIHQN